MFKLTEVAIYPVKSPEVTETLMQEKLNENGLERTKEDIWRLWLTLRGREIPQGLSINDFLATYQSDRLHLGGIKPAWLLIVVTMVGAFRLWASTGVARSRWIGFHAMVVLLFAVAVVGTKLQPEWFGLFQRISFVGVYAWMWLLIGAIQREQSCAGSSVVRASNPC
jgi:uncharacterized membrane protein YhaH (DUF805 family)